MTKKHYVAIAAVIHARFTESLDEGMDTISMVAYDLADYFASVNPLFKRDVFLKACGIPEHQR